MSSDLWPAEGLDGARESVTREVLVEASREEVWEAIASERGRERWLEDAPERAVEVELEEQPSRLVWWWSAAEQGAARTRVEFLIRAVAGGTEVRVIETAPRVPIEMLARCAAMVLA